MSRLKLLFHKVGVLEPSTVTREKRTRSLSGFHRRRLMFLVLVGAGALQAQQNQRPNLIDRSAHVDLNFVHQNGMVGELYFPEMTGQGGALFDFDNDGDLDLYLVQGGSFGDNSDNSVGDLLLRNDLHSGLDGAQPRFVDITAKSGITATGYGMGVATGDFDGDGNVDFYVTNFGPNQLWRNQGDGTFVEIGVKVGVAGGSWSTSATFLDFDNDGHQDLYLANYVHWDLTDNSNCYAPDSRRDYCGPSGFTPTADKLYRNLGNGKFQDVTFSALSGYIPGPGLGVLAGDFNKDGEEDIFVANDGERNQLWIGQGDGTFVERGLMQGVAVNLDGEAEASMGIAARDFDNDGDEDLFVTHLMGETNTLYVNQGDALFEDQTRERGLAEPSLPFTSFGAGWLDLENDGQLDLFVASGSVKELRQLRAQGDPFPLGQPNQLYSNNRGRFSNRSAQEPALKSSNVSRGMALGDVDNDGDTDVAVFNSNGPARLLDNTHGQKGVWLGVSGTKLLGTDIRLTSSNETERQGAWARSRTAGSYCSASDPRLRFGLGASQRSQTLEVKTKTETHLWVGLRSSKYYVVN